MSRSILSGCASEGAGQSQQHCLLAPHAVRDETGNKKANARLLWLAPLTRTWELGEVAPMISHFGLPCARVSPSNASPVVPGLLVEDLGVSSAAPCHVFPQNT